jgi:hypothetical protein
VQTSISRQTSNGGRWNRRRQDGPKRWPTYPSLVFQECRLDRADPSGLKNLILKDTILKKRDLVLSELLTLERDNLCGKIWFGLQQSFFLKACRFLPLLLVNGIGIAVEFD